MNRQNRFWSYVLVAVASLGVYWKTAYPTINWWDSSSYSLATSTLGVAGPPGSLLLTLLGWPITQIANGNSTAFALNLLAGLLAALTIVGVYAIALRVLNFADYDINTATAFGAAAGALALAFSMTMWEYAVQFTPYMLTAVFTTLIWLRMIRWWDDAELPTAWRHFAWLGLLIGLDFSVHRTNSLLALGVLAWVLIRHPRTLLQWRIWAAGTACLLASLSLQLLLIPISRYTHSPLFWNDTSSLTALWDFISLKRLGGGFLVSFWPRNAPFWSSQVWDVLRTLSDDFFHWNGVTQLLGVVSTVMALIGTVAIARRTLRLAIAFVAVLVLQIAATVLYFNIPEHFFRSLDRHYLPICVTIGIAIACGVAVVTSAAVNAARKLPSVPRRLLAACTGVVALCVPAIQLADNWQARNASDRHFAGDYARNALVFLPPHSIYFTVGDNDTFPLLYMQAVENVRRDVQVVNLSLLVDPAHAKHLVADDSTVPVPTHRTLHDAAKPDWTDSTFADIVRINAWRRPLTFALTATGSLASLRPFARLDGNYYRVMRDANAPIVADSLRANLFRLEYRGYANSAVVLENVSQTVGGLLYLPFEALLEADRALSSSICQQDKAKFLSLMPPERLGLDSSRANAIKSKC